MIVLSDFSRCMESRLGPVSARLGERDPNTHTGMVPVGVSYQRVFNRLREAAEQKGGSEACCGCRARALPQEQ